MNLRQAKLILSPYLAPGDVTAESVRAAFAEAVKANHPDSVKLGEKLTAAADRLKDVKQARDVWLTALGAKPKAPCAICGDRGIIGRGFHKANCPRGCKP